MKQAPEVHEGAFGLFIVTEDGIFKYNESENCFKAVKICDESGVVMQRIGTVRDDPKEHGSQ